MPGFGNFATVIEVDPTSFDSSASFSMGFGDDSIEFSELSTDGSVTINTGPGAGVLFVDDCSFGGFVSFTRGDGGSLASPSGYSGSVDINDASFSSSLSVTTGSGKDKVELSGLGVAGGVSVSLGTGESEVSVDSTTSVAGAMNMLLSSSAATTVLAGGASGSASTFGSLTVATGSSSDAVTVRNISVSGNTSVNTGFGGDTIAIDQSSFTGTVGLTTGPDGAAFDGDTVNIERVSLALGESTFFGLVTINTGGSDDSVFIGVGSPLSLDTRAHFYPGFTANGGTGTGDLIDYIGNNNVFQPGATVTIANFETIT